MTTTTRSRTALRHRRSLAAAAVLIAAASLTACSVDVVEDGATDAPSAQSTPETTTTAPTPAPTATAPVDDESGSATSPDDDATAPADQPAPTTPAADPDVDTEVDPDTAALLDRSLYSDLITHEVTCDGGDLTLDQTGVVVSVSDDCATLTVSGTGTVVLAQSVENLVVTGTGAVVLVSSVDTVEATGAGASIGWESGTPAVTDSGTGTVATQIP